MPVTTMSIDSLHITPLLQPRGKSLCKDAVTDYTAAAKAGAVFPPLLAFTVTDRKFPGPALVAGFHRHKAFKAAELTECEVELREGTFAEAWLAGFLSNSVNGLRYSREQKRHAVEQALLLFKKDSARQLAERLGVSNDFVSKVRKELVTAGKLESVGTVTSKDGASFKHQPEEVSFNDTSSDNKANNTSPNQNPPSSTDTNDAANSDTSSPSSSSATASPTSVRSSGDDAATGEQGSGGKPGNAHAAVDAIRNGRASLSAPPPKKQGSEVFRWQDFDKTYGPLVRLLGDLGEAYPDVKDSDNFTFAQQLLEDFIGCWKRLRTAVELGAAR